MLSAILEYYQHLRVVTAYNDFLSRSSNRCFRSSTFDGPRTHVRRLILSFSAWRHLNRRAHLRGEVMKETRRRLSRPSENLRLANFQAMKDA